MIYGQEAGAEDSPAAGEAAGATAEESTVITAEDEPTSIYQTQIGDADVDFFLQGSWNANAFLSSGIRFGPDSEVVFPWGLPNMREGFVFEQIPDLTLSVWLMKRYFMEVTMVQEFENNTFLLGYQGLEGELLQSVRIGNRDVSISSYDFLTVPEQGNASLGASAVLTPGFSRHELLLRYDNTLQQEKVFVGNNEVVEKFISPANFVKGRSFMLPDTDVVGLEVYLEYEYGEYSGNDGKKYRKASVSDIEQDSAQGLLFMLSEAEGRILVYYTKGGNAVGAAALGAGALPGTTGGAYPTFTGYVDPDAAGVKFDWTVSYLGEAMTSRQVTVGGKTCLMLWEPGAFSPFEFLNCYELPAAAPNDLWRVNIKAVPRGDELGNYRNFTYAPLFEAQPGSLIFRVYIDRNNIRTDFWNHYPFPDSEHQLYGPLRDHNPGFFDWEIYTQIISPINSFYLAQNVVIGSVSVKRNGMDETRFDVDYTSGIITFHTTINPDDRLEVTYSVAQGLDNNGDILFVWGNQLPFSELFTLDIAAGVRWNMLPGAYCEQVYSRTGVVLASLSLHGKNENLAYKAATALSFSNPDTTGILRLLGMERKGIHLSITEDMAYPAAKPVGIAGLLNRGRLLYKDYRQYDFLGSYALKPLSWSVPSEQVFSYTNGSKPGPYLVGESAEGEVDKSLVLDFELDNTNDWVGFQIPVVAKQGVIDLSHLQSILYAYRVANLSGNADVYIQIGDLAEDIDDDGVLDEELSKLSQGFLFNDTDNSANLYVGGGPKQQGNNIIDSEDVDGNSFLDAENAEFVFTSNALSLTGATGWSVENIYLTPADQELLKRVRSLRVIVVNTSGAGITGRILIDTLRLEGTSFWTDDTAGSVDIREVEEQYLGSKPARELEREFSEVRNIFHNTGDDNKVLELNWLNPAGAAFEVKSAFRYSTEGVRYRKVVFYAAKMNLSESGGGSTVSFSFTDAKGKGIHATLPHTALTADWQKVIIDLQSRTLSVNDTPVAAATVSVDNYGALLYFSVHIDNTDGGTLLLDEVHLRDPEGAIGAAFAVDTDLTFPGTLVEIGGVPLLSDVSVRENFSAVTPGFAGLYGEPSENMSTNSLTEVSCGILGSELDADFTLQGVDDEWSVSGGHRLKIPKQPSPIVFTDSFSLRERSWGNEFSRSNELIIAVPGILSLYLLQKAQSLEEVLSQNWSADLTLMALTPYSFSFDTDISGSSRDFSCPDQWYLESWIYSYQYFLPQQQETIQNRRWNYSILQALNSLPVGARFDVMSGYDSYDITGNSMIQENFLELSLALPIKIGTITVTPGYNRTLNTTRALSHIGSFTEDLGVLFEEYQIQDYIWTLIPLYELFSEDTEEIFRDKNQDIRKATYKPELTLGFIRPFGSRLWDLVVPSQIDIRFGKELSKQDTLYDDITTFSVKTKINAINLFGKFGAYSFIDFYTIDEYATAFDFQVAWDEANALDNYSFSLENRFQFENQVKNSFIIHNRFTVEEDEKLKIFDQGSVKYQWYIRPENGIEFPLIDEETAAKGFVQHTERIDVQAYNLQDDMSSHPLNIILTHETSFIFPDLGYIRGEVSLGMDWEYVPEQLRTENIMILGFRVAIEVYLTF
ncbi:MAG: hypothetical protein JW822_01655 [Spirochaetales bacterium]|nr:hypothetical protein [Spirochaetales bacterium]